jgi:metallo-beta-lactamase family protein
MMKLTFHGAAREVTGSMHLVEVDGALVALDCGLFQGRRLETESKNRTFPVEPARIHAVVLSHAHVDHCGRLPLLVKRGFTGPIYSTPATRDLSALLMADSAHIQQEDIHYVNRKRAKNGLPPVAALYDEGDAASAMRLFHCVPYGESFAPAPRLTALFRDAGHMLGSASIELTYQSGGGAATSVVFTGDVGRSGTPMLHDPAPLPPCDYLITESTYGARRHPPTEDLAARLALVVNETISRGGKVIVPAFSIGRTQVILHVLHQLRTEGRIPDVPVFVDSPLAVNATEVFRLHPELFDEESRELTRRSGDAWGTDSCTYVREAEESKKLNTIKLPCVIISASGMCENGRVVHHLKHAIESPKNTVLIVGFQAAHTLGRRIVEKQPHVTIFGEKLKLRAEVVALNGFSAHADRDELQKLLKPLAERCKKAFLVHGEPDQMEVMAATMRADGFREVLIPGPGESFEIMK